MIGIKAYGVSIPYYRMSRGDIHETWLTLPSPMRGERTVANFDEDSLTMAVAAGIDCLTGLERRRVDGIFKVPRPPFHIRRSLGRRQLQPHFT